MRLPTVLLLSTASYAMAAAPPSAASVLSAMASANDYFIRVTSGGAGSCGWTRGAYFAGNAAHISVSGNASLVDWATGWAVSHNWACNNSKNANDQICGAAYAALWDLSPEPERLAGLRIVLDEMAAPGNNYTSWTWIDAVFMALPSWLEYGVRTDNVTEQQMLWSAAIAEYTCVWDGGGERG